MKNVMQVVSEIRGQEPAAAELEQAAARVRQRLFPADQTATTGALRSCAAFVELLPASLAGSLDSARQLLLTAHIRECLDCRRAADRLRQGAAKVVVMPARPQSRINYQVYAVAASVVLVVGAVAYLGVYEFPALQGGPRATVEQ